MTSKEVKREIRETKAEMKIQGIRRISCFNGGLSAAEYRWNSRLYQLSVDLELAIKAETAS
jgi:hypothetical protein